MILELDLLGDSVHAHSMPLPISTIFSTGSQAKGESLPQREQQVNNEI